MQLFLHIHWLNIWRFNQSQVTNIWNKIPEISKKAKLEFCTYILCLNGSCITNIYTKKFFRQITELIFLKKFRICITENACILIYSVHFSSVQSVVSNSLRLYESQHARPPCPSPTPRVYSNSCPSSQ